MNTYPAGITARTAQRQEILRREVATAEAEALRIGRSPKCSGYSFRPVHAGMEDGCANDGTTCLCACHDKPDAAGGAG